MKRVYILLLSLLVNIPLFAESENMRTVDEEAAQAYQEGNFARSIELYEQLLSGEQESAVLYYNLGNAYYKTGEMAKAILNYERALLLRPGDKDVKYNLDLAQRATVDDIKVLPELFLVRWYNAFVTAFSADQWAYISVALFIVFLVMAVLFFHATSVSMKKLGFSLGILFLLLSGVTVLFANKQYHRQVDRDYAIVMTPSVVVRGAPDDSGTELFVIHEGLKVRVIESLGDWYNVRLADGNEGWIGQSDLEKI